jgi:hypothetical protein
MLMELSPQEKELLAGLLERELDDTRSELHHTRGHEFKDSLKEREKLVRGLLARVQD